MQRIRKIADDFFERQELKLPLTLEQMNKIARNKGFEIYAYSEAEELIASLDLRQYITKCDGFTGKRNETKIIFYKDGLPYNQIIKIIVHEIGHIELRHSSSNGGVLIENKESSAESIQEQEARIFALELQAPIPILQKMNISTVDEIMKLDLLNEIDAMAQITYMREQQNREEPAKKQYNAKIIQERRNAKNMKLLVAAAISLVVALSSIMMWQRQDIVDGLIPPVEPTTPQYIESSSAPAVLAMQTEADTSATVRETTIAETTAQPAETTVNNTISATQQTEPIVLLAEAVTQYIIPPTQPPATQQTEPPTQYIETTSRPAETTSKPTEPTPTTQKVEPTSAPEPDIVNEAIEKIVHVTHAGEKYHLPDCRYVKYNNSVTVLTLGEAVEEGYEPCKVCKP